MDKMTVTAVTPKLTVKVQLSTSKYGTPQPEIVVTLPGNNARQLGAAAHMMAAKIELVTEDRDRWLVGVSYDSDQVARVYLELLNGFPNEVRRGMATLKRALENSVSLTGTK